MTNEEVNKLIAEYMDTIFDKGEGIIGMNPYSYFDEVCYKDYHSLYTESLDALVPVWEKLQKDARKIDDPNGLLDFEFSVCDYSGTSGLFIESNWGKIDVSGHDKSIQRAAAHATAKAIKELEK